jgi:hypothetical protein
LTPLSRSVAIGGGSGDFPDVWQISDRAPVIADFGSDE